MNRAEELVRRIEKTWNDALTGHRPGYAVAFYVVLPHGQFLVEHLLWMNDSTLMLNIRTDAEFPDILFLPVEQAIFQIRHFLPKNGESRVIVGFGPL